MIPAPYAVHWFRRDLRLAGNPALQASWTAHQGRVLGLFTFDHRFLARPDFSVNRFAFFLETLSALQQELREAGGDLLVLDVGPREALSQLLAALDQRQIPRPSRISFNRDYEPYARERDDDLLRWIPGTFGIAVNTARDHLLIEPEELTRDGALYQVYSPFAKKWFERLGTPEVQQRIDQQRKGLTLLEQRGARASRDPLFRLTWPALFGGPLPLDDQLESYRTRVRAQATVPLPPAGSRAALTRLTSFLHDAVHAYHDRRDIPSIPGTSQLSIYLKNGSLTTAQILAALPAVPLDFKVRNGLTVFVKELAWREFYYHVLYHRPEVERTAFLEKYRDLAWENREDWFTRWTRGETGYPIVDAGMRQLNQTGWMHNRVRMIVASFLTKDLLIDWRWGERYFMEKLLDGDLAPNNGGWQWAASTGCDPQPYFRIFNPTLQAEKFDPSGEYIRRFVPELRDVPDRDLNAPHRAGLVTHGYPPPIVDHAVQKDKALALYRME